MVRLVRVMRIMRIFKLVRHEDYSVQPHIQACQTAGSSKSCTYSSLSCISVMCSMVVFRPFTVSCTHDPSYSTIRGMHIKRILKLVRHDGHMNASFAFSSMSAMRVILILSIIKLKLVRHEYLTSHAHT